MSMTYGSRRSGQTAISIRRVSDFLKKYRRVFQERRERRKLTARLAALSDRELIDIGTSRGEIDYVASNRLVDPRGIRSAEWMRHLPTVDGYLPAP